jgi:hypothetical protein
MRTTASLRLCVLMSIFVMMPAHSHHSFAMFDESKCVSTTGVVKKFQWAYPHAWLWLAAEGAADTEVIWGFEGGDPASLAVLGWKADLLKKGDKVTVYFNPLRDGRNGGSLRQVVLPTGATLGAQVGASDEKYFKACAPSGKP